MAPESRQWRGICCDAGRGQRAGKRANFAIALPFVFIGNVGEEGEGDLRGMRNVFATPRWRDAIAYNLVVDGAGADTWWLRPWAAGRFEVMVRGPGGHSWSDSARQSDYHALPHDRRSSVRPRPASPKTTFNARDSRRTS